MLASRALSKCGWSRMANVLVTGCAGFIGFHVASRLVQAGNSVLGIDNLNDYYDVSLKEARLGPLAGKQNFHFQRVDSAERKAMEGLFRISSIDFVVHLAAQAGVRYSLANPAAYIESNLV